MSDLSRVLGLDHNPVALSALNSVGQSLALSAGQVALNKANLPINLQSINLAQFVPTVPTPSAQIAASGPAQPINPIQHNGLKTVFHALIEGVSVDGLTVSQYIAAVEARLDAWVDSIG